MEASVLVTLLLKLPERVQRCGVMTAQALSDLGVGEVAVSSEQVHGNLAWRGNTRRACSGAQ